MYYGLVKKEHAKDIAEAVVDCLGGDENTVLQILETCQQETQLGEYKDSTNYAAGTGLAQADKMPFEDRQRRLQSNSGQRWVKAIKDKFDIDWYSVEWRELEHSPLLSMLDCRLLYKLVPDPIPKTVKGRAEYWKQHYNTVRGKGTVKEYIHNAKKVKL